MIVAAGGPPAITQLLGSTVRLLGATPKLHCIMAPMQTWIPIRHLLNTFNLAANERESEPIMAVMAILAIMAISVLIRAKFVAKDYRFTGFPSW
jgi:hypothetical protein